MAATASVVSGVAGRYATALFEIAKDAGTVDAVEADLGALQSALDQSAELRDLISSPVYSRDEQSAAMTAIAAKMGLGELVVNTVRLMASKRRLPALPGMIAGVRALAAQDRGEVTAEVTTARPMTDAQAGALKAALKKAVGSDVSLNTTVDEGLIGGLVVKVGSQMVDTSIRTRLASLQNAMKEVR
ncbi:MAG: F0F1 ATP synthase subunit delta [Rubricella sp.]